MSILTLHNIKQFTTTFYFVFVVQLTAYTQDSLPSSLNLSIKLAVYIIDFYPFCRYNWLYTHWDIRPPFIHLDIISLSTDCKNNLTVCNEISYLFSLTITTLNYMQWDILSLFKHCVILSLTISPTDIIHWGIISYPLNVITNEISLTYSLTKTSTPFCICWDILSLFVHWDILSIFSDCIRTT